MRLLDVLKAVKTERLSKTQLEDYYAEMNHLLADLKLEEADLKRKKAVFLAEQRQAHNSATDAKNSWNATEAGQRLILLEGYRGALRAELDSTKTRIYALL